MKRLAAVAFLPFLLSACGTGTYPVFGSQPTPPISVGPTGEAPPGPLARSATYTCEDLTTVVLTEGQINAQVTFNSGLVLGLARQPDPMGLRFGAPPYEFRARGSDATMFNNGKWVPCRIR